MGPQLESILCRMSVNLWTSAELALDYLGRADSIPHRAEGEGTLLEFIPQDTRRILDLGTGDGRWLTLVKLNHPRAQAIAIDFSPAMVDAAGRRFADDCTVTDPSHNLDRPLPPVGEFDLVISSFAIHHLIHERKRAPYPEIFRVLSPGGAFCNLEQVAFPTPGIHQQFLQRLGVTPAKEEPSNKLLDVETQLVWLRKIGFTDVDYYWKWRELALLAGHCV
jgi:tRNA (cmo5U34)-methyltransferase